MDGLREAAAFVDAPEPEVAEDLAVAFGGADHHAGKLPVEFAGHDDRGRVVLGGTHQQAAVFGVGVRGDLEVEPRGEQRKATGEEQGGAGDASEAAPAGLHGGQFLLRAHPSERNEHAGQESERHRIGKHARDEQADELEPFPAADASAGDCARDLGEDIAGDHHEHERAGGGAAGDGGFGQDVAVEKAHVSIQADPARLSKAKGSGRGLLV